MKEFDITISGGKATIKTPYNPDFVQRVKALGGRWNASARAWQVREEAVDEVRKAMIEVYGRCDQEPTATVTVVLKTTRLITADCAPVFIMGKLIASAKGRDSGATVGEDVAFVSGQPTSGGSRIHWTTIVPEDCTIELYGIPADYAEREIAQLDNRDPYTASIKSEPKLDIDALTAERERLMARIAEIDALLASTRKDG